MNRPPVSWAGNYTIRAAWPRALTLPWSGFLQDAGENIRDYGFELLSNLVIGIVARLVHGSCYGLFDDWADGAVNVLVNIQRQFRGELIKVGLPSSSRAVVSTGMEDKRTSCCRSFTLPLCG